jgi:cell division protein FtsI/penicillin-binding protein 2
VLLGLGIRIALRAATDYAFFLSLGLVLLIALQALLIAAGVLDLAPLSGVVTPFLSFGRSSMLANFAIFGILLSVSRRAGTGARAAPFRQPVRWVAAGFAICAGAVLAKAAWVQVLRADATAGAGALVMQADGARRYQYNPRIMEIARSIPRGAIYDRNGLPLATSDWQDLEDNRAQLAAMGIDIERLDRRQRRFYPLGPAAYHLLGDLRTRANWGARNSSLAERDSAVRLQGYDDRARVVEVRDRTGATAYTIRYDFRELLPLLRHRWEPDNADVKRVLTRERDLRMSLDARLQLAAFEILARHLKQLGRDGGALVAMDAETGDLLASVSLPAPALPPEAVATEENPGPLLDRARYGLYPPGSTFKVVTAMAALRRDPLLAGQTYQCVRLPDGRVGNYIGRSRRPVRDDVQDRAPHGTVNLERGLVVSCNAYFAQLAAYKVGAEQLLETSALLGISAANPPTAVQLRDALPQAGYGQGQVVATPFQMARAAAAVAAGGRMPFGRWVLDESNARVEAPREILGARLAAELARDMRGVVTNGTGRRAGGAAVPIAGKTGTAELGDKPSHAWFIGFAPYGAAEARRIAFAVIVEHGRYGGAAAAPVAADLVAAAARMDLFRKGERQ